MKLVENRIFFWNIVTLISSCQCQKIQHPSFNLFTFLLGLQIINLWQNTDFHLSPHQGRDTFIIAGADDIMAQLEESQVTIGTIKASRYIAPIQVQILLSFSQIYQSTFKSDSSFFLYQYYMYLISRKTCLMVEVFTWYKKKVHHHWVIYCPFRHKLTNGRANLGCFPGRWTSGSQSKECIFI